MTPIATNNASWPTTDRAYSPCFSSNFLKFAPIITTMSVIQNSFANQQFYAHLLGLQTFGSLTSATALFPSSDGPINPFMSPQDEPRYTQALESYESDDTHPDRYLFRDGDTSVGHKIHLNVTPQHVRRVSEYLRDEGFRHKYLRGGEVEDGKIFPPIRFGTARDERYRCL